MELQGENTYIDGLPKITVADAAGTRDAFLEKMFGVNTCTCSLLDLIAQTVYYHYWDNWTRRGAKAKAKRDDLEEDYECARKAVEEGADYVGIGAVYDTSTKKLTEGTLGPRGVGAILEVLEGSGVKAVAIGACCMRFESGV